MARKPARKHNVGGSVRGRKMARGREKAIAYLRPRQTRLEEDAGIETARARLSLGFENSAGAGARGGEVVGEGETEAGRERLVRQEEEGAMAVDLDVPQLLEMYSAGLELIYNHYCEEEEGLDAQAFMQLLTDCNIVPDPSLPEPSGKTPGSCRLGAVSAASVNKIFRSGVRNRSDQMLTFPDFVECLERSSLMGFSDDTVTGNSLEANESLLQLLRSIDRSGVYNDAGGPGRLLRPQHVGSIDVAGNEPQKQKQQQQQSKYPAPREGTQDLSAKETDELLRSLFARYCEGGGGASGGQMSAGKFYKLVRECGMMDGNVTQQEVGHTYKRVMQQGHDGTTFLGYADFVEALALLAQAKYDSAGTPLELFTRLINSLIVKSPPVVAMREEAKKVSGGEGVEDILGEAGLSEDEEESEDDEEERRREEQERISEEMRRREEREMKEREEKRELAEKRGREERERARERERERAAEEEHRRLEAASKASNGKAAKQSVWDDSEDEDDEPSPPPKKSTPAPAPARPVEKRAQEEEPAPAKPRPSSATKTTTTRLQPVPAAAPAKRSTGPKVAARSSGGGSTARSKGEAARKKLEQFGEEVASKRVTKSQQMVEIRKAWGSSAAAGGGGGALKARRSPSPVAAPRGGGGARADAASTSGGTPSQQLKSLQEQVRQLRGSNSALQSEVQSLKQQQRVSGAGGARGQASPSSTARQSSSPAVSAGRSSTARTPLSSRPASRATPTSQVSQRARSASPSLRKEYRAPSPRPRSANFVPRYKSIRDVHVTVGLQTLSLSNQYITSLEGLGVQLGLKTLYLQNNFIKNLDGFMSQPKLIELHLEGNRIESFRGMHVQPHLERIWIKGNPVTSHEYAPSMCLMAVGNSLLRIDDTGILPEIREQTFRFGPRAAEAVREGWLVDSIQRTDGEWDALLLELQVQNRIERDADRQTAERSVASRRSVGASPRGIGDHRNYNGSSTKPASEGGLRGRDSVVAELQEALQREKERSEALARRMRTQQNAIDNNPNKQKERDSMLAVLVKENERLHRENTLLFAAKSGGSGGGGASGGGSGGSRLSTGGGGSAREGELEESLKASEARVARLETKLAHAFSAEELIRLPYIQFRHLRVTLQGQVHESVSLALSEDGLCLFQAATGASMAAITCDDEIQVSGAPSGFSIVSRGTGRCEVEHKYASVVGRIVRLWMAYKKEKRRLQVGRLATLGNDSVTGGAPPLELKE